LRKTDGEQQTNPPPSLSPAEEKDLERMEKDCSAVIRWACLYPGLGASGRLPGQWGRVSRRVRRRDRYREAGIKGMACRSK
jgi:hypothetical protein